MSGARDALRVTTEAGDRTVSLSRYLDPDAIEISEGEANRWVKSLRHARVNGVPLRDRFTCRGDSLWWFMELYLHKERVINSIYRTILALEALVEREHPRRIDTLSRSEPEIQVLGPQVAKRHGVDWPVPRIETPLAGRRMRRILGTGY
ncbi:MAG: hypothetical protein EHM24_09320, partial [Acidobacteria bacterium]